MSAVSPFAFLLPEPALEIIETRADAARVTIAARAVATIAVCPRCGERSQRVHSYYTRRPRDLPLSDRTVRLVLHVRRFRCLNAACTAATFACTPR